MDNILADKFLQELRDESEQLIADYVPPESAKYHGHHIQVLGSENTYVQRLLEWQPTRNTLEAIGFGDFTGGGGIIILTKDPGGPAILLAPRLVPLGRPNQLRPLAPTSLP